MQLSTGFIERVKNYSLPDDLDKVNREFLLFASEQGLAYEKITCGGRYTVIRDKMVSKVNDEVWSRSKKYRNLSDFEKNIIIEYINNAVLMIYRQWIRDGKKVNLEKVIELTNKIVLGGVNEFFK